MNDKYRDVPLNGTYTSSMLSLQVDELLLKMRPDYERRMIKIEDAIRKLKRIINNIPNREPMTVSTSSKDRVASHTETFIDLTSRGTATASQCLHSVPKTPT